MNMAKFFYFQTGSLPLLALHRGLRAYLTTLMTVMVTFRGTSWAVVSMVFLSSPCYFGLRTVLCSVNVSRGWVNKHVHWPCGFRRTESNLDLKLQQRVVACSCEHCEVMSYVGLKYWRCMRRLFDINSCLVPVRASVRSFSFLPSSSCLHETEGEAGHLKEHGGCAYVTFSSLSVVLWLQEEQLLSRCFLLRPLEVLAPFTQLNLS